MLAAVLVLAVVLIVVLVLVLILVVVLSSVLVLVLVVIHSEFLHEYLYIRQCRNDRLPVISRFIPCLEQKADN